MSRLRADFLVAASVPLLLAAGLLPWQRNEMCTVAGCGTVQVTAWDGSFAWALPLLAGVVVGGWWVLLLPSRPAPTWLAAQTAAAGGLGAVVLAATQDAVVFGLGIGLVSSLLGVAGGELIIPTLVFAFGAGIKTAGTASLLISLPTVGVGVLRHRRLGSFTDRSDLTQTVAPMGIGSVIGAVAGGLFVGVVSAAVLKFVLGVILIVSAVRIFHG